MTECITQLSLFDHTQKRIDVAFDAPQISSDGGKIDVNQIVNEIIMALKKDCESKSIVISAELADDLPCLYGDSVQVREVINNLIT